MTIEDCINKLIAKEKCMERDTSGTDIDCNSNNCDECSLCYEQGTNGEQKEALRFAIDTMRKYQKIQEIIDDWKSYAEIDSYDSIAAIYGVLKDEKID